MAKETLPCGMVIDVDDESDYETDYEARENSAWYQDRYASDDVVVAGADEVVEVDDSQELAEVVASGIDDIDRILSKLHDRHPAYSR